MKVKSTVVLNILKQFYEAAYTKIKLQSSQHGLAIVNNAICIYWWIIHPAKTFLSAKSKCPSINQPNILKISKPYMIGISKSKPFSLTNQKWCSWLWTNQNGPNATINQVAHNPKNQCLLVKFDTENV